MVTEQELAILHDFDIKKLRGKAFTKLVIDKAGTVREEVDLVAQLAADVEKQVITSFSPRDLNRFLAAAAHHKVAPSPLLIPAGRGHSSAALLAPCSSAT